MKKSDKNLRWRILSLPDLAEIDSGPVELAIDEDAETISDCHDLFAHQNGVEEREEWRVEVSDADGVVIDSHDGEYIPD